MALSTGEINKHVELLTSDNTWGQQHLLNADIFVFREYWFKKYPSNSSAPSDGMINDFIVFLRYIAGYYFRLNRDHSNNALMQKIQDFLVYALLTFAGVILSDWRLINSLEDLEAKSFILDALSKINTTINFKCQADNYEHWEFCYLWNGIYNNKKHVIWDEFLETIENAFTNEANEPHALALLTLTTKLKAQYLASGSLPDREEMQLFSQDNILKANKMILSSNLDKKKQKFALDKSFISHFLQNLSSFFNEFLHPVFDNFTIKHIYTEKLNRQLNQDIENIEVEHIHQAQKKELKSHSHSNLQLNNNPFAFFNQTNDRQSPDQSWFDWLPDCCSFSRAPS